jgi:hypothetical protein
MSHEHEMSTYERNGDRVALPALLDIGQKYQRDTNWIPPTVLVKAKKEAEDAAKATEAAKSDAAAVGQEAD